MIPKITAVFESEPNLTLPWYTVMVIDFSGILVNYWYMILGAGFVLFGFCSNTGRAPRTGAGSTTRSCLSSHRWKAGAHGLCVSIHADSGHPAHGGVPMLNAMSIVRNVVGNVHLAEAIDRARDNISEGESIAGP